MNNPYHSVLESTIFFLMKDDNGDPLVEEDKERRFILLVPQRH